MAKKALAVLVLGAITVGPTIALLGGYISAADRRELSHPPVLIIGGLVWLGLGLWALNALLSVRCLTMSEKQVSLVRLPFRFPPGFSLNTKEIRRVDMDTKETEHQGKHGETYSTYRFNVLFSRSSTPNPATVYSGTDEAKAKFLHLYLSRRLAAIKQGKI
jgi:hypothetical protein